MINVHSESQHKLLLEKLLVSGGIAGVELWAVIGATIGTIVPVLGNIIIGFIGGLIGGGIVQFARYIFCIAPASPWPGVPILDTGPYPTYMYTGIPDQGLDDNVYGAPEEEYDTEAFGILSVGVDTGAFGTPESEYRTRRIKTINTLYLFYSVKQFSHIYNSM